MIYFPSDLGMPKPLCQGCFGDNPKIRLSDDGRIELLCDNCYKRENFGEDTMIRKNTGLRLTREEWDKLDKLEDKRDKLQSIVDDIERRDISLTVCERVPDPAGRAEFISTRISTDHKEIKKILIQKISQLTAELELFITKRQ